MWCAHACRVARSPRPLIWISRRTASPVASRRCFVSSATAASESPREIRRTLGVVVFLSLACVSATLGVWQLQRREWKVALIQARGAALRADSVPLEPELSAAMGSTISAAAAALPEFQRVTFAGVCDYSHQFLVGPRAVPTRPAGEVTALARQGAFVVTPCRTDAGTLVLVNRGWIERNETNIPEETHDSEGRACFTGVTRAPESRPRVLSVFSLDPHAATQPQSKRGADNGTTTALSVPPMLFFDVPAMCRALECAESAVLVDANSASPSPRLVRRSNADYTQFATTPLVHAAYAITWFGLAAAIAVGTVLRFRRPLTPLSSHSRSRSAAAPSSAPACENSARR